MLKIKKLTSTAIVPKRAHANDAGLDLYVDSYELKHNVNNEPYFLIDTGIAVEIPKGWVGMVVERSSCFKNYGLSLINKIGIIDSDYRGALKIQMKGNCQIPIGERVAQLIIVPCMLQSLEVEELSDTSRGEGGFGSTGKK